MKLIQLKGGLFPKYRLIEDHTYRFYFRERMCEMVIPAGFEYDGATMGSFLFWRKTLHTSEHTAAHDYGYQMLGNVHAYPAEDPRKTFILSKEDVDDVFLRGIRRQVKIQKWRSIIASGAIKSFGLIAWYSRKWGLRA